MLEQKKLAEDVGFHGNDFASLIDTFSKVFFGSETFYSKCDDLIARFKYALTGEDIVIILSSYIQLKRNPSEAQRQMLASVTSSDIGSSIMMHRLQYLKALL